MLLNLDEIFQPELFIYLYLRSLLRCLAYPWYVHFKHTCMLQRSRDHIYYAVLVAYMLFLSFFLLYNSLVNVAEIVECKTFAKHRILTVYDINQYACCNVSQIPQYYTSGRIISKILIRLKFWNTYKKMYYDFNRFSFLKLIQYSVRFIYFFYNSLSLIVTALKRGDKMLLQASTSQRSALLSVQEIIVLSHRWQQRRIFDTNWERCLN